MIRTHRITTSDGDLVEIEEEVSPALVRRSVWRCPVSSRFQHRDDLAGGLPA